HSDRRLLVEDLPHTTDDVALSIQPDDRIAECDHERLMADERARRKHGVPQAERPPLTRVEVLNVGAFERQRREQLLFTALTQQLHQLFVDVEMVLERSLARAGD